MRFAWIAFGILIMQSSAYGEERSKYLIIHADDAGMSHSVNRGTIHAMENGIVSSASIMVPCPWFKEFAEYASEHPERDYGIHLTLNSEWKNYRWGPVTSRDKVPSLVDEEGYLWDNVRQVAENAKANEVEIELRAQIDRAKKFGVPLTHLDTHMGALFSRPDLLDVYIRLGLEYDLPVLFVRKRLDELAREYPALADRGRASLQLLDDRKLGILDNLGQFYGGSSHQERRQTYIDFLKSIEPGVTELIIHCGYDDAELQSISSSSPRRDGDRRIFCEDEIKQLINELGIQVISWKQFQKMQRTD